MSTFSQVDIKQEIHAPIDKVAAYIEDFRNAKEWMVGVERVDHLPGGTYRIVLDTPVGKIEPSVKIVALGDGRIRWEYISVIEGGGKVEVRLTGNASCTVSYTGEFRFKNKMLNRAAHLVGIDRVARMNGERSLARLKHLMEARRY